MSEYYCGKCKINHDSGGKKFGEKHVKYAVTLNLEHSDKYEYLPCGHMNNLHIPGRTTGNCPVEGCPG